MKCDKLLGLCKTTTRNKSFQLIWNHINIHRYETIKNEHKENEKEFKKCD